MKLESNYIRTTALGAAVCGGASPLDYAWQNGKCRNKKTGVFYPGDQKLSNCHCLFGPAPTRTQAALDFFLSKTVGGAGTGYQGAAPGSSFTSSGLLVPAIAVVGGVALLLILTKKK